MALSQLLRKSLTKSTHCFALLTTVRATQLSPPSVPKTMRFLGRQPIAVVPSIFKRTYCINQHGCSKALELSLDEQKKKLGTEKEIEEQSKNEKETEDESKNDKEREAMQQPEGDIKKAVEGMRTAEITELFNTDQKILILCLGNFDLAHHIASKLGDARNIVVISEKSCDEMKRMYECAESYMLELKKLGATVLFDVDFFEFQKDNRINNKLYDRIIWDQSRD
ncbi:hypothetical protein M8C21_032872 [Ambrosia artemisiifolia]|uniref:25S rRNA (uridine-N(3))-methyltransferase BMT5-like domain-containing protein n=1 Tax=Ambrosia artemisiifolia TaxID=4212 RepID=A0AAD5CQP2_AMBAR|nr:hypothetical protein M8C21_032872 [Ambrosia artemisiifolia]